jgi:hypothetical protein
MADGALVLARPVERFLSQLERSDETLLIDTACDALSLIEVWTLATVLGYRGTFGELADWARPLRKRQGRLEALATEAKRIEDDLAGVRRSVKIGTIEEEKGLGRVSALSKELRGYLVEIEKISERIDRRALLMTGAECVIKELRMIFSDNPEMQQALTSASMAAWMQANEQK